MRGLFILALVGLVSYWRAAFVGPATNSRPTKVSRQGKEMRSWKLGRCAGDKRIKDRWNAVIKTGWGHEIAMAAKGNLMGSIDVRAASPNAA